MESVAHLRWDLLGLDRGAILTCYHRAGDGGYADADDLVCVECGACGDCCRCVGGLLPPTSGGAQCAPGGSASTPAGGLPNEPAARSAAAGPAGGRSASALWGACGALAAHLRRSDALT
jgi:hypothetical protein